MASVFTVSQVNSYIKNMFAQDFALNRISIKGEVSNCKYHTSGHIYFTLKDERGTLAAVMFSRYRMGLDFRLEEGMKVVVEGSVEVYERDGKYQLYAKEIKPEGKGDLYLRFELLKKQLEEMGMFAAEYKQEIPAYARTVGIVTAATGAAVQDIINIASRRNPYVQLVLYPALVQGEGAKYSIVKGIKTLDAMNLDVLIVGRGGGSIEDLWAFNEELVAWAIFEAKTPVISAVGHETDVTIADYAADLRAPTPSAAAELAVFDWERFEQDLNGFAYSLQTVMNRRLERERVRLEQIRLKLSLKDPERKLNTMRQYLAELTDKLHNGMEKKQTDAKHRLELLAGRLQGVSPLNKISGGFGYLSDPANRRITSIDQVSEGMEIQVRVKDGKMKARVTETMKMEGKEEV